MPAKAAEGTAPSAGPQAEAAKPGRIEVASLVGGASLLAIVSGTRLPMPAISVRGWLAQRRQAPSRLPATGSR